MRSKSLQCPAGRGGARVHQQLSSPWSSSAAPQRAAIRPVNTVDSINHYAPCRCQTKRLWQTRASSSRDAGDANAPGAEQQQQLRQQQQEQEQLYKEWCLPLLHATRRQLRVAAAQQPHLLSAPFLFWLQDTERAAKRSNGLVWVLHTAATQSRTDATHNQNASSASTSAPSSTGFIMLSAQPIMQPGSTDDNTHNKAGSNAISHTMSVSADGSFQQQLQGSQEPSTVRVQPAQLSRLASELVAFREQQDQEASQRLLPALASSAAYDSLARWRQESGTGTGGFMPTPGVPQLPVEQLYRITEAQERDLRDGTSTWAGTSGGLRPNSKSKSSSPSESAMQSFASQAYGGLAASAMQRVRARFLGFEDGAGTAAQVLDTLLWGASDTGERAELLHVACNPPGIPYQPPPQAHTQAGPVTETSADSMQHRSHSAGSEFMAGMRRPAAGGVGSAQHLGAYSRSRMSTDTSASHFFARRPAKQPDTGHRAPVVNPNASSEQHAAQAGDVSAAGTMMVTTPKALLEEVQKRLGALQASGTRPDAAEPGLPCGNNMQQALEDLIHIVTDYEASVWSSRPGQL